jgi:hypothetical protein
MHVPRHTAQASTHHHSQCCSSWPLQADSITVHTSQHTQGTARNAVDAVMIWKAYSPSATQGDCCTAQCHIHDCTAAPKVRHSCMYLAQVTDILTHTHTLQGKSHQQTHPICKHSNILNTLQGPSTSPLTCPHIIELPVQHPHAEHPRVRPQTPPGMQCCLVAQHLLHLRQVHKVLHVAGLTHTSAATAAAAAAVLL